MIALINGKIHTITGPVFAPGMILMDQGKILAVGENLQLPQGCEIIDLQGMQVFPGFIDAHCHVGIIEEIFQIEGDDGNEISDPVTPQLRAIDGINPEDLGFKDAYSAGITTLGIAPGSANVIGGEFLAMKTYGRIVDQMVVKNPVGIKIAFGENPKRVYGQQKKMPFTRMATAALLREALTKAQNYLEKLELAKTDPDKKPEKDLQMEALVKVLKGEIPLRAHAHRADDIVTALRIAEEFKVNIVIEHCTEGHKIADYLAAKGVPAVVGPNISTRAKVELMDRSLQTPAVLAKAGVKVAMMTDHPVIPIHFLPLTAALAVREGLPEATALEAITIQAAQVLGIADRVGSIEIGKDADLVILDGHPFQIMTQVHKVFIDGHQVFSR